MDRRRFSVIQSRVSLVLSLTDTYTGGPPLRSSCLVRAEGREIRPLYKDGGYVVFQNLPGEPIRFCVESPYYADETVSVDLSAVENGYPVLPVPLTPSSAYPFPRGTTLLRASIRDGAGHPRKGMRMDAEVLTDTCTRAKVAQDDLQKGSDWIQLAPSFGKLFPGQCLKLKPAGTKKGETVRIVSVDADGKRCRLEQKLRSPYRRGTPLYPVIPAKSDDRGEIVFPFPVQLPAPFEVLWKTAESDDFSREVRINGGEINNVGTVSW